MATVEAKAGLVSRGDGGGLGWSVWFRQKGSGGRVSPWEAASSVVMLHTLPSRVKVWHPASGTHMGSGTYVGSGS